MRLINQSAEITRLQLLVLNVGTLQTDLLNIAIVKIVLHSNEVIIGHHNIVEVQNK